VKLLELYSRYSNQWARIAKEISGRTDVQCKYHCTQIQESLHCGWDIEEDNVLMHLTSYVDDLNWEIIHHHIMQMDIKSRHHTRWPISCMFRYQEIVSDMLGRGILNGAEE